MKNQQKSIRTFLAVVLVLTGLGLTHAGTCWAQAPRILFLPLVLRDAVTPGPGPVPGFLQNGGFENSPLAWAEASTQDLLPLANQTGPVAIPAHTGLWGAWLCGTVNEISKVGQFVLVPAGTPFLTFWVWIDSLAPCGLHTGQVLVNGLPVDTFNLCTTANTNGWVKRSVNLTAFSGLGVNLEFQGNCNTPQETISNLFLDDVVFAAAAN